MLGWLKKKKLDPKKQLAAALKGFRLPTFPKIAMQALEKLRAPDSSLAEVARIVSADPGISARVLAVANSAAYGLRREVRSVEHAVALLGRNETEALVLAVSTRGALPPQRQPGYEPARFWRAAARRAAAARALAAELHPATRGESFTASLLQDMALPLLASARGSEYHAVLEQWHQSGEDLSPMEQQAIGCDHASVAGWLCGVWKFPDRLTDAIGAHHEDPEASGAPPAVSIVGYLGEASDSAGVDRVIGFVNDRFGIPADDVASLLKTAFDQADEIATRFAA